MHRMPSQPADLAISQNFRSCAVHCLLAKQDNEAAALARARFADPAFDWPGFLEYVRGERISSLVHDSLGGLGIIPSETAASIQEDYLRNAWMNTARMEDLHQVIKALELAGIRAILLKGAALICTLYEKKGLRRMEDIDLLVRAEDFARAGQVLISCAYQPGLPPALPADAVKEIAYRKAGSKGFTIDLHCSLFTPPHELSKKQLDWFWENVVVARMDGIEVFTFNPTAQLLHLCAHLWLHHGGGTLLWEYDIDQLIRRYSDMLDWPAIPSLGQELELLMPLQKTLPHLAAVWKTPVPQGACEQLALLAPSPRERQKFGKVWSADASYLRTFWSGMMSYPDWRGRLRYAWIILFPPRQYIVERYKVRRPLLVPYFYLYRLVSTLFRQR